MFSTPLAALCWIEHYFLWLNDIMPHASEKQKAIGQKSSGQRPEGDGAVPRSPVGPKDSRRRSDGRYSAS
jgi:hypothetical protein